MIDTGYIGDQAQKAATTSAFLRSELVNGATPEEVQVAAIDSKNDQVVLTTAVREANDRLSNLEGVGREVLQG
ncbi:MAG: hypothetical protein AB8C46_07900 [Burkholderiaceae bacterium]